MLQRDSIEIVGIKKGQPNLELAGPISTSSYEKRFVTYAILEAGWHFFRLY